MKKTIRPIKKKTEEDTPSISVVDESNPTTTTPTTTPTVFTSTASNTPSAATPDPATMLKKKPSIASQFKPEEITFVEKYDENGRKITKYDQLLDVFAPKMKLVILDEMQKLGDKERVAKILEHLRPEELQEKSYELAKMCLDQVLNEMLDEHIEKLKSENAPEDKIAELTEFAAEMSARNSYNNYMEEEEIVELNYKKYREAVQKQRELRKQSSKTE